MGCLAAWVLGGEAVIVVVWVLSSCLRLMSLELEEGGGVS